ncbi:hypothetical protein [Microvirga sp. G4-2]|uniref:hypothetical protein n=1 Tax=Microvirga sp. G4-2 TaxID=3434467 RepID=UPI0040448973
MAQNQNSGPRVPTERPDPADAARNPRPGSQDRPGFDLGGSVNEPNATGTGSNTVPGGPKGGTPSGTDAAGGVTDGTNGPA